MPKKCGANVPDDGRYFTTSNPGISGLAGIMLAVAATSPRTNPDFGMNEEEVARYWCDKSGIPWLGRADIGTTPTTDRALRSSG